METKTKIRAVVTETVYYDPTEKQVLELLDKHSFTKLKEQEEHKENNVQTSNTPSNTKDDKFAIVMENPTIKGIMDSIKMLYTMKVIRRDEKLETLRDTINSEKNGRYTLCVLSKGLAMDVASAINANTCATVKTQKV